MGQFLLFFDDEELVSDPASLSHRGLRLLPLTRPAASERSSSSLADRIRAGDATAERELVERFSRGVRVILRNAGADPSAADDLHQETFRIALERIRSGELRDPAG